MSSPSILVLQVHRRQKQRLQGRRLDQEGQRCGQRLQQPRDGNQTSQIIPSGSMTGGFDSVVAEHNPSAAPLLHEARQSVTKDLTRTERIAEAVEHLRANHACVHEKWRWIKGKYTCEECHHVLKEYIFECKQCNLQACSRCRRNRLCCLTQVW